MLRSRAALVGLVACLVGVVSGSIAGAQADTTGPTGATGATGAQPTVTVNGAGWASVDANASMSTIQSTYMGALQAALTDAHGKATALASQSGDTLGAVQNITEQSNDGSCSGPVMYAAGSAKGAPAAHRPKHHSKPKVTTSPARAADAQPQTCRVEADVTVTYAMS